MSQKILVIEDNDNIRRFIRTTLSLEGYAVEEATTVRSGLDQARKHQPALVLLDLALPDGTGWDFLESLRGLEFSQRPRVAILTASADHGMADRSLAAGADEFITKPIAAGALVSVVRRVLQAGRAASAGAGL